MSKACGALAGVVGAVSGSVGSDQISRTSFQLLGYLIEVSLEAISFEQQGIAFP